MKQNLSDMYYYCERCGQLIRKPELFNPEVIPMVKINGKLYCCDCVVYDEETNEYKPKKERLIMEENKLNLKPFNLKAAKEGKPVCTRDGRKARIICFDRKFYHDGYNYPIVAMVNHNDNELVHAYTQDGLLVGNMEGELDLMMLPEKKEGWVNVYKERIYSTKEEAIEATYDGVTYVDTVKVCWEE